MMLDGEWHVAEHDGEYDVVAEDSGRSLSIGEGYDSAQSVADELNMLGDALYMACEAIQNREWDRGMSAYGLAAEFIAKASKEWDDGSKEMFV